MGGPREVGASVSRGAPVLRDVHLVLYFTRGVSLATWRRVGNLGRELARTVRRAVIDDQDVEPFVLLEDEGDLARQVVPLVVRGHDHEETAGAHVAPSPVDSPEGRPVDAT